MKRLLVGLLVAGACAVGTNAFAHHSFAAEFDATLERLEYRAPALVARATVGAALSISGA